MKTLRLTLYQNNRRLILNRFHKLIPNRSLKRTFRYLARNPNRDLQELLWQNSLNKIFYLNDVVVSYASYPDAPPKTKPKKHSTPIDIFNIARRLPTEILHIHLRTIINSTPTPIFTAQQATIADATTQQFTTTTTLRF